MTTIQLPMTDHAAIRQRQRGIPDALLALLLRFGTRQRGNFGTIRAFFDKRSRARLRRELGAKGYARWEAQMNSYAVLSEDAVVITVGHRLMRFHRR